MNNQDKISYLVGKNEMSSYLFSPYDELLCNFLDNLSVNLRSNKKAIDYPDVLAFAFWCRKGNISLLKKRFDSNNTRLGVGLVFHITPSNVPVNFAYSFAFGLLSGNSNIVRVPSKLFPQVDIICETIDDLFSYEKYSKIKDMTNFIRYEQNNEITGHFSSVCNARIIWGGDVTIQNIRKLAIPERCVDIAFSDRYSFCLIDASSLLKLNDTELIRLSENFYNDTYLMDQNACSSPHLLIWYRDKDNLAKSKFWKFIGKIVREKYKLETLSAVDKYSKFCNDVIKLDNIRSFNKQSNDLYRISLDSIPDNMDELRGEFGYFYEYDTDDTEIIFNNVNNKYQTLTYFGFDKSFILNIVLQKRLQGIDRIVPIGKALDMDVIWDGYDIGRSLSRIIDVK